MMGKTHITMGMAASMLLPSETFSNCIFALAGGAIGGVLADIDLLDEPNKYDVLLLQVSAFGLFAVACSIDHFFQLGTCDSILNQDRSSLILGIIGFVLLWMKGVLSPHRDFTHSLAAMFLFSLCFSAIDPWLEKACLAGYASHLVLDLINKKGLRLFYPFRQRVCFKLCYANKLTNKIFLHIGFILVFFLFFAKVRMLFI